MILAAGQHFVREFHDATTLHPLGLLAAVVLGLTMVVVPRRYAIWPMIVMACFVAPSQRLVIAGADFTLLRIMVLCGSVRILVREEWRGFVWKRLDLFLAAWAVVGTLAYTALRGTAAALVFKLGTTYDALGMYLLFRCLLRDWEDLPYVILGFIVISLPVAAFFLMEWSTGRNLFSFFGGISPLTIAREGRLRCRGAFAHPILAGCFWAAVIPLMAALWWHRRSVKWAAPLGLGAALLIVVLCASATPVMAVIFAMVGAGTFLVRHRMKWIRRAAVLTAAALHLTMDKPVWFLLARVDVVGGSTGWHRFNLINQAVHRLTEWWLLGTVSTAHWGWLMYDITNQYLLEGVRGGLLTLALFVAIIAIAFRRVGAFCRAAEGNRPRQIMAWALGVSLFVHCTSFIAISYFGQIVMVWYLTLAMIGSMEPGAQRRPVREVAAPRGAVRNRYRPRGGGGSAAPAFAT